MKNKMYMILAFVSILFGLVTLKTGGLTLFTAEGRISAGNYVPFVLWFNFTAGFFYTLTGIGIYLEKPWSLLLAKILASSTFIVFIAFGVYVLIGGSYELKTVGAMTLRTSFWTIISVILSKTIFKKAS